MPDDIQRMLATSPLMAGLDPGLLGKIATAATPRRLRKGEILFRQGDRADAVWGVLDGSVTERVTGTEGKEFFLAAHEPGAIFGIVSTLDWGARRAEASARTHDGDWLLREQGPLILARRPIDGVLEHARIRAVVLRSRNQDGVRGDDSLLQPLDRIGLTIRFHIAVVDGDVEQIEEFDLDVVGRKLLRRS